MQVDQFVLSKLASAGNRTRAARVAGEHSTTEPPMLAHHPRAWPWFDFRFTFSLDLVSMVSNWSSTGPHFLVGRNSSVGRALDWRSKGPWFNPGFRQRRLGGRQSFQPNHMMSQVKCASASSMHRARLSLDLTLTKHLKVLSPRRGIEPRSPAWQAGILTTILSRITDWREPKH